MHTRKNMQMFGTSVSTVRSGLHSNFISANRVVTAAFLVAITGFLLYDAHGRERISLDSGWRFQLGDPPDVTTNVTYYPEINYLPKLNSDEVTGTNSETYMESIRVDIFGTHAGENVSFVQTNLDDSAWRQVKLPHDWAVELPFNSSADGGHGYKALGSP